MDLHTQVNAPLRDDIVRRRSDRNGTKRRRVLWQRERSRLRAHESRQVQVGDGVLNQLKRTAHPHRNIESLHSPFSLVHRHYGGLH